MLIRTKLIRPTARAGLVERPRLVERLDEALARRVTLVSAPPGFGKTTIATEWAVGLTTPCAWLALDVSDNEPEQFVRYLVAAVSGATEDPMEASSALLAARVAPPIGHLREVLVAELAALETPLVLVLEDYHAVASEDVQRLMERLVPVMPASLHLVVLTRRDPPWPLGHWRAQGWLVELRGRDLRFSLDEARTLFVTGPQPALSEETVARLHTQAEGWVAGLRLVQLSLRDAPDPEARARAFSGSDRLVVDYLMSEVLAAQPRDVREFLTTTAPLPRFSVPLCDHLLAAGPAQPPARETIAHLLHENLFVVPLDGEGQWYRYHHLFQDLLLHHLPELSRRERRVAIARRAAEWFEREGLIEEALRHWIAAGDLDAAAALVGEHLNAVVDEDLSRRRLSRWLALFPGGAEHGRLPLLVAHGYLTMINWNLPRLASLLDEAEGLLPESTREAPSPAAAFRADIDAQRAFLLYWSGDAAGALRRALRVLEAAPASGAGLALTAGAIYAAGGLAMTGRRDEGLRLLEDAVSEAAATRPSRIGELLFVEGALHLYAADLASTERTAVRALATHETAPMPDYWLAHVLFLCAAVAYERNRLDEAAVALGRVAATRYRTNARIWQDGLIGLCLVARARADAVGVARYAAQVRAAAVESGDPTAVRLADSLEARLALDTDRPVPASGPPTAPDFMFLWLEVPSLTYAERLVHGPSAEMRAAALPYIEQALARVNGCHNVRQAIPFALVRAMALADRGDEEAARLAVAQEVDRAEPLGLVRTFVDRGPRLRALVDALAKERGRGGYLGTLVAAFQGGGRRAGPPSVASPAEPWNELSNRERDVLELLAERFSNKEIAERLHVSPETVKRHTLSIYRKLGVRGRRPAVVQALAKGLIVPRTPPPVISR